MKVSKFRCLGKNKNGSRCNNKFLTNNWTKELTCTKHKDQKVDFQYSPLKYPCPLRDVAYLIAKEIDDPVTFANFAKVCLTTAKCCHRLQDDKKKEFSQIKDYYGHQMRFLPNGDIY